VWRHEEERNVKISLHFRKVWNTYGVSIILIEDWKLWEKHKLGGKCIQGVSEISALTLTGNRTHQKEQLFSPPFWRKTLRSGLGKIFLKPFISPKLSYLKTWNNQILTKWIFCYTGRFLWISISALKHVFCTYFCYTLYLIWFFLPISALTLFSLISAKLRFRPIKKYHNFSVNESGFKFFYSSSLRANGKSIYV
jgi:hypothetical protein